MDWRDESKGTDVVPGLGDCLVFSHPILHAGAEVRAGRKYAVRTDVMYSNHATTEATSQCV